MAYSKPLVDQVQAIIDGVNQGKVAPLSGYNDIADILKAQNIAKVQNLAVDAVLCHPSNRDTLGLNAWNVHRNGHMISQVGCDMNELQKAACFELCPLNPKKGEQIAWNEKMVASAAGLLAPVSGKEAYLSVGTGHFVAWCRAVKSSCRTPFEQLACCMPDMLRYTD